MASAFVIASSSNDDPLMFMMCESVGAATQEGEAYGYVHAYRSHDPFLVVLSTSKLGEILSKIARNDESEDGRMFLPAEDYSDDKEFVAALNEAANAPDALGGQPELVPG